MTQYIETCCENCSYLNISEAKDDFIKCDNCKIVYRKTVTFDIDYEVQKIGEYLVRA